MLNVINFQHFLLLFSNRVGIHKTFVRIANQEEPDQTASEDPTASSEAVGSGSALFVLTFLICNLCLEILEHLL